MSYSKADRDSSFAERVGAKPLSTTVKHYMLSGDGDQRRAYPLWLPETVKAKCLVVNLGPDSVDVEFYRVGKEGPDTVGVVANGQSPDIPDAYRVVIGPSTQRETFKAEVLFIRYN